MISPEERDQMRAEAGRAVEYFRIGSNPDDIPPDEVIASHPVEVYRPPQFLSKTAPGRAGQLASLFEQLWEVNEEWVGERTWEVHAYAATTGFHLDLRERLRGWCAEYFETRSDPAARLNQQNGNDPFVLAWQVSQEWRRLLDRLTHLPCKRRSRSAAPAGVAGTS